jgi:hypothetical protein
MLDVLPMAIAPARRKPFDVRQTVFGKDVVFVECIQPAKLGSVGEHLADTRSAAEADSGTPALQGRVLCKGGHRFETCGKTVSEPYPFLLLGVPV